jgi:UDP-N-acetylglucosamine acyltransferase
VGLRRAGIRSEERLELKRLYHHLFRGGKNLTTALGKARSEFSSPAAQIMLEFVASAKRGVCSDIGAPSESEAERQIEL